MVRSWILKVVFSRVKYEGRSRWSHQPQYRSVVVAADAHHHGEQELTANPYLDISSCRKLQGSEVTGEEASPKISHGLYISKQPKNWLLCRRYSWLIRGTLPGLVMMNLRARTWLLQTKESEITTMVLKTGRQKLGLHYQGQTVEFDDTVSPKAAINDEYHRNKKSHLLKVAKIQ